MNLDYKYLISFLTDYFSESLLVGQSFAGLPIRVSLAGGKEKECAPILSI